MELGTTLRFCQLLAILNLILEENLSSRKELGKKRGLSPSKIFAKALSIQTNMKESLNLMVLQDDLSKEKIKLQCKSVVSQPRLNRRPTFDKPEGKNAMKLRIIINHFIPPLY
jgi:hypothetical protein